MMAAAATQQKESSPAEPPPRLSAMARIVVLRRKEEIPLWTLFIIGFILMSLACTVVFLMIRPYSDEPVKRLEVWEYWNKRFHLKISYNTTESSSASRNTLDAGRGCLMEVNSTQIMGELAYADFVVNLTRSRPEPVLRDTIVFFNKTNATMDTSIVRMYSFYCAQTAYVLTVTKRCDFEMTKIECTI